MTLRERLLYISGYKDFSIQFIPCLGLLEIKMVDGSKAICIDIQSTIHSAGILFASTRNRSLLCQLSKFWFRCKRRGASIL